MSELTADKLAQRIYDCRLMENKVLQALLADAREPGDSEAGLGKFTELLLGREHLTNWQVQRLTDGHRVGYFYGNWKVLYLIGAGTFARVYRAVHTKTGDVKAVKVLRSRHSSDDDMREQFLREARMVMKLRHPNIVPIQEVETERDRLYMVMDFVEGQNLRDYVLAHRKLSPVRSLKVISDLANGLAYAADLGIGHRDMKLSNVLLSAKGQAKLVDFGLATVSGDDESGGPRSVDYAALERHTGVDREDPRSDIFFLGCMLYHMLVGVPALEETGDRFKRLSATRFLEMQPITNHDPDLPHRLVVFVNRLLALDPNVRTASAKAAHRDAEAVLNSLLAGDTARYDAKLTEKHAADYAEKVMSHDEGQDKTLLLIESNLKLQDTLREKLKKIGYRVLITADPERGLERFENYEPGEVPPVDCVIFGTAGLGRSGLRAFLDFAQADHTKELPALVILTDQAQRALNGNCISDHRVPFSMPLKFKKVQHSLRKLLKIDVSQ